MTNIFELLTADPNLSPTFARLFRPAALLPIHLERANYERALRQFDWAFEFADDASVYRRGLEALAQLRIQQQRFDPAGHIWLSIAPAAPGTPQPVVKS